MAVKRKLSATTSPYLLTSSPSHFPKKSRQMASIEEEGKHKSPRASKVKECSAPDSQNPYDYADASVSDNEEQPSLANNTVTVGINESTSECGIPKDNIGFGYRTTQGWHSINDPNKPRHYALFPLPTEEKSEEEAYMKLNIWATDRSDETSSKDASDDHEVGDTDDDQILRRVGEETKDTIGSMKVKTREKETSQPRKNKVQSQLKNMVQSHATASTDEEDADDENDGNIGGCHWIIVGDDESSPQVGVAAPKKLTIRLVHKTTKVEKVAQFRKMREDEIDWNNKIHIKAISMWRRQYFRRNAFPLKKKNVVYTPDEDAFLMIMYRKIKDAASGSTPIKAPATAAILDEFNHFFEFKTGINASGTLTPLRAPRDEKSFNTKLNRPFTELQRIRTEIQTLLQSVTGGEVYMPTITGDEIRRYRAGETDESAVPIEVAPRQSKYAMMEGETERSAILVAAGDTSVET